MLIDALVALAILAIVGGSALQLTRSGLQRARLSELRTLGRLEAQSRLDEVGGDLPLAPGVMTGRDGPLTWRVQIDSSAQAAGLLDVLVTVTAGNEDLVSLRTARGPA